MRVNFQLWVFFCCAIFATSLAAQSPEAKDAAEKLMVNTDQKAEQKTKRSETGQPSSTRQTAQKRDDVVASPVKPFNLSQPNDDSVFLKRDVAQRTLEALHSAIQTAFSSGIDRATIKIREDELRTQLMEAKKDSDFDEITSRAATFLAEITREGAQLPIQGKAGASSAEPAPGAMRQLDSSRGNTPLILSIVSLIISIFALVFGPWFCREASRKATEKALMSAGLK